MINGQKKRNVSNVHLHKNKPHKRKSEKKVKKRNIPAD